MSIWTYVYGIDIWIMNIKKIFIYYVGINNCKIVLQIMSMNMNIQTLHSMCLNTCT
jgi:hypothetical protein